jgi:hypothetical protein
MACPMARWKLKTKVWAAEFPISVSSLELSKTIQDLRVESRLVPFQKACNWSTLMYNWLILKPKHLSLTALTTTSQSLCQRAAAKPQPARPEASRGEYPLPRQSQETSQSQATSPYRNLRTGHPPSWAKRLPWFSPSSLTGRTPGEQLLARYLSGGSRTP